MFYIVSTQQKKLRAFSNPHLNTKLLYGHVRLTYVCDIVRICKIFHGHSGIKLKNLWITTQVEEKDITTDIS